MNEMRWDKSSSVEWSPTTYAFAECDRKEKGKVDCDSIEIRNKPLKENTVELSSYILLDHIVSLRSERFSRWIGNTGSEASVDVV